MALPARKARLDATPFPTAERAALAAAIVQLHDARTALAATTAAAGWDGKAAAAVRAAEAAIETAKVGIETAKSAAASHIQAEALGEVGEAPRSIRAARADLQDAEDALVAAKEAKAALDVLIAEREQEHPRLERARDRAVQAVAIVEAGPAAAAAFAKLQRAQRELLEAAHMLTLLSNAGAIPRRPMLGSGNLEPADPAVREAMGLLNVAPMNWGKLVGETMSVLAPWQAAIAALREDATALLPVAK